MFEIGERDSLRHALISMGRVINALVLREISAKFGRLKISYVWALLEPMLFITVLAVVFSIRRDHVVYGMPVLVFLLTGIVPFLLFRNTMGATMKASQANLSLLYFPQINPFELVVARSILEFVTMLIVFIILIFLMQFSGFIIIDIESPLKIFFMLLLASFFGFCFGVAVGAWVPLFPILEDITNIFIGRPMFFVSGIFFTVEMIPIGLRDYLLLNPLFHIIEMFRSAYFKSFESIYTDMFYTLSFILIFFFLALLTQRALRRYAIQQ